MTQRRLLPVTFALATGCSTAAPGGIDAGALADHDATPASVDAAPLPPQRERLRVVNRCAEPLWIAHGGNLPAPQNQRLAPGELVDVAIPASGLASVRLWPKLGCDDAGNGCRVGQSGEGGGAPCPPAGCQPPIDSKFEVTFAALGSGAATFYNLSLVDGYTLPFSVEPVGPGAGAGSCTSSDCAIPLDACPAAEQLGGGHGDVDLRVTDPASGAILGCLSPCKAWHYPAPFGLGLPESQDPGLHLCCPTPIDPGTGDCTADSGCMTPEACRDTADPLSVVHTDFVALVHARCPTAYAYSYDDAAGLHACPADAGFAVTFCP